MLSSLVFIIALLIIGVAFSKFHIRKAIPNNPFVERDANGFLSLESYQSHIQYYTDGSMEVDLWALSQTENFHKAIKGSKQLREFVRKQNKS